MAASVPVMADVLSEFLEVAIHGIIYSRNIYPKIIYECRKKYDAPVQMSTHPELNEYIGSCVASIRQLLSRQAMKGIIICILDSSDIVREKFVLQLSKLQDSVEIRDGRILEDLERKFRAFLLRIYASDVTIGPPLSDCRFTIKIDAVETEVEDVNKLQEFEQLLWIDADEIDKPVPINIPKIIPIKSMETDFFSMQLYAEQLSCPSS